MTIFGMPTIGRPAPGCQKKAVVDGQIKDISLASYTAAHHWLVLIFYPKAWSFICPTEIKASSARLEEFLYSRSCAVAFASTDSEVCLKAWNNASDMEGGLGGVHVPLISDSNHQLCKDYGVLIENEGIAQRALFIIDPRGIIRGITVNDADIGRSVDEAQRVLDALVFKDEFGEGCPVDWKRGDRGIDMASKVKSEGSIEIPERKSWTEWARPKLGRAFSGASQRSVTSITSFARGDGMVPTLNTLNTSMPTSPGTPPRSGFISRTHSPAMSMINSAHHGSGTQRSSLLSPILSPTSISQTDMAAQLDAAVEQQSMENMQAAMANQQLGQDVGVAN
ncbi:cTPxI [Oleoguttula sp. CCFEE 5521]